jgi:large-conductance mechanosensitive channel
VLIDFLIVSFVMFLVVKSYDRFRKETPTPEPSEEVKLLTQIRDSLAT